MPENYILTLNKILDEQRKPKSIERLKKDLEKQLLGHLTKKLYINKENEKFFSKKFHLILNLKPKEIERLLNYFDSILKYGDHHPKFSERFALGLFEKRLNYINDQVKSTHSMEASRRT